METETNETVETVVQPITLDTAAIVDAIKSTITDEVKKAVDAAVESEPAIKTAGVIASSAAVIVKDENGESAAERKYAGAFKSWIHREDAKNPAIKATLAEGTDANGGFVVPNQYANEIIEPLTNLSYMRRPEVGARTMQIRGTDSFRMPVVTYSAAASLTAESGTYGQSEPTFAEVEFKPFKYTKLSRATEEIVADSKFDVWNNILKPDYVQAFAEAENSAFTVGTGSNQPQGFVTGATVGVTLAAGQTTTISSADSVIDLYFALDYKYRDQAVWMMNDATLKIIRKLKDSTGAYIVLGQNANGLGQGGVPTIMGRPVVTNNAMATPAANALTIVFGNFAYYGIADFGEMGMQRLDERFADSGHVGFRAFRRIDGRVLLAAAFQALKQSAT